MNYIYKKKFFGSSPYHSRFEEEVLWNIIDMLEPYMNDDNCVEPDIVFETIVFNYPKNLSSEEFKPENFWRKFDRLYRKNCRQLVGRNYNRNCNRKRLPRGYVFLDFPYSKKSKKTSMTRKSCRGSFHFGVINRPHSHAIYIVPPSQKERTQKWISRKVINEQVKEFSEFLSIPVEDIDRQKIPIDENIFHVLRYSAALLKQYTPHLEKKDLWNVLPTFPQ
jgi:hypothetical protein